MADMWWWLLLGVFGQQAGQKAARPEPAAVESPRITVRELDSLLGGQDTINVPSWSPKEQLFAYITYRLLGAGDTATK